MAEGKPGRTKDSSTSLRVLYAEDNRLDAELVLRQLKKVGLDLHAEVVDTAEAFQDKLLRNSYDVILSDQGLPGWSLTEVIRIVKQHAPNTPLIVVTGMPGDEAAAECIKKGATDCVVKDRLDRLPGSIRRALGHKR